MAVWRLPPSMRSLIWFLAYSVGSEFTCRSPEAVAWGCLDERGLWDRTVSSRPDYTDLGTRRMRSNMLMQQWPCKDPYQAMGTWQHQLTCKRPKPRSKRLCSSQTPL